MDHGLESMANGMFIFCPAGTNGAPALPPGAQAPEVIMTKTALRRRPAGADAQPFPGPSGEGADLTLPPPWSRADLLSRDDSELLELVKSEPIGSAVRSAACEILVTRYEALATRRPLAFTNDLAGALATSRSTI